MSQLYSIPMLTLQVTQDMPEGSLLQFDKELLFRIGIQVINIIVLTVILVYLLYKPVKKYMAGRTDRIKAEIEAARLEREEAQELKEKYEAMIENLENEREEVLLQAHRKAMKRSDQLLFDARQEADAMYHRALAELETERENITDEMKEQMIEISMMVANKFIEVSLDQEAQDRYIEEALADWEGS